MQLYPPLLVGARLILSTPKGHLDPPYIVKLLVQHQVTKFIFSVPTMVSQACIFDSF
jgi:non-ribosomal peptide synthetase component F